MRNIKRLAAIPVIVALAACGDASARQVTPDLSFLDDLELAVEQSEAQQTVSPLELGEEAAETETPTAAPVKKSPAPAPARQTTTRRAAESSGTYSAPAPVARTETVKHTKRDAAIGAGAGAVIGAVAGGPNRRVQGAVVGAVVGGVIGGVIGNNVDKSTRVVYDFNGQL